MENKKFEGTQPSALGTTTDEEAPVKTKAPWYETWGPIIVGVILAKLLSPLGALVALGAYYVLKPKVGRTVAGIIGVASGLAVGIIAMSLLSQSQPPPQPKFVFDASTATPIDEAKPDPSK